MATTDKFKTMPPDKQMEKRVDPRNPFNKPEMKDGKEYHENTGGQLAAALNIAQRDNIGDRVRELVASERMRLAALEEGYETFEDADDFAVDDDDTFDPQTPYEEIFEGSVSEDVKERFQHQKDQLRKVKADGLRELLAGMDADELDAAYKMVRPDKKPDKGEPPKP